MSQKKFLHLFDILPGFAASALSYLSIILLALLTVSAGLISFYAEEMENQIMISHFDPLWLHLPLIALFVILFFFLQKQDDSSLLKIRKVLLPFTLAFAFGLGVILLVSGRSIPASDAYSVYSIAASFAEGNLAAIQPTGDTYLSFYPQQIGLIAYYEIVIRLWNLLPIGAPAYHVIKLLNVLFACCIILFQYRTVRLITQSEKAQVLYLLLALGNFPLIFYTSYVYGEIPSFAFFTIGLYFLLKYEYDSPRKSSLALSTIALTLSVMLRKNTLVLIIAVLIAVLFHWLKTHKHALIIYGLIVCFFAVSIQSFVQKTYEYRADNYLLPGVSAYSYFAMGMQESMRGNGWYNGFNFYTYQDTGLDNELTEAISKEAIATRLAEFKANPAYALAFYRDKLLSQWTDGSYACRQAVISAFWSRSGVFESLFDGTLGKVFSEYCNIYQTIIYGCVLLFLLRNRRQVNLLLYIGIIGIIGGFLFHIIWEANSRYILAYWLLMMPYAAMSIIPNKTRAER